MASPSSISIRAESVACIPVLIPAAKLPQAIIGLGIKSDVANLAARLPQCFSSVVSSAVYLVCFLNDGAWEASTSLEDEEACDTVAVLAAWGETRKKAAALLDFLLSKKADDKTQLFPRSTDTEAAFKEFSSVLNCAVARRVERRRDFDAHRKQRLDFPGFGCPGHF